MILKRVLYGKKYSILVFLILLGGTPQVCSMWFEAKYSRHRVQQQSFNRHVLDKIEKMLTQGATKQEILACVGTSRRPVQLAVDLHRADLIEPLIRCGFVPNWDFIKTECEPPLQKALKDLWRGIPVSARDEIYDNSGHGVSAEQLIPSMYAKYRKRIAQVVRPTDLDMVKELVRCGATGYAETFPDRLLASIIPIAYDGLLQVPAPGWRTKTWRSQVLAFLMAGHLRTGVQSPANVFSHWLVQEIAQWIPKHMSMQDRWARRNRKQKARAEWAIEPSTKRRKTE